jgi:hypothetical protein
MAASAIAFMLSLWRATFLFIGSLLVIAVLGLSLPVEAVYGNNTDILF